MMRSISIGGAAIEGTITTASGEVQPVKYERYSNNLADVTRLQHLAGRQHRVQPAGAQPG